MKIRRGMVTAAAICVLLSGCGGAAGTDGAEDSGVGADVTDDAAETEIADESSNAAGGAASDDMSATGEAEQTDEADAAEASDDAAQPFIFRDVYGVEYETVINPNIPKKTYPDDAFVKDGDTMAYLDGEYALGIDVSHHQGYIDWDAVKADGYDFAILRIGYRAYGGEGSLNADRWFEDYYQGAREAGLSVGVYFFAQAINEAEAKEEADFVLGLLGGRELDLPVVYDPESILDDVARTDDVTGEQFTANTKVFCETISAGGYEPMIYANMLWEAFELDLEELAGYPIWYADYEDKPQTPYDFSMWQYTNEGSVSGVDGVCDIDILLR